MLVASNKIPSTWDKVKNWWHDVTGAYDYVKSGIHETITAIEQGRGHEKVQVDTRNLLNMLSQIKSNILATRHNISYMRFDDPEKQQYQQQLNKLESDYKKLRILLWPYFKAAGVPEETMSDMNLGIAPVVIAIIALSIAIPATIIALIFKDYSSAEKLKVETNTKVFLSKNIPWIVAGIGAIGAISIAKKV